MAASRGVNSCVILFLALEASLVSKGLSLEVKGEQSVTAILSKISTFRNVSWTLCETMSASLEKAGHKEDSESIKTTCNDWISILGINKGLTGLAKDFALNYWMRSSYHDKNGKLISAISKVAEVIQSGRGNDVRQHIGLLCAEGRKLFTKGGALFEMLTDLSTLLSKDKVAEAFDEAIKKLPEMYQLFDMLHQNPDEGEVKSLEL